MDKKSKLNISRLLRWLSAAVVLAVVLLTFPRIFSYIDSQGELMAQIRQMLEKPVREVSLVPGSAGREAEPCFVTESRDEISRIVEQLKDVRGQLTQGTTRREPFVLTLTFADESQAIFVLYRRSDDLSRAHLERIEYAQSKDRQPELVSDAGLEFPEIGAWAAAVISRYNCR